MPIHFSARGVEGVEKLCYCDSFSGACKEPIFRRFGQRRAINVTTTIVPTPPKTTDGTSPNHFAVNPDSMPPSSLLDPMKTWFTALTRPRIESGVINCTSV